VTSLSRKTLITGIVNFNRRNDRPFVSSRKLIAVMATAGLVLAFVYAHIRINGSEEYTGPLLLLDHAFDISLALGLAVVLLSVGNALSKRFGLEFASTAEEISFSVFLGTGVAGLSVLCLGLLGLLRPWPVAALLALSIGLSASNLPHLNKAVNQGIRAATATSEAKLLASLFLCLLALLMLHSITPPHVYDEAIYHLPVTRQFVQQGRIFPSYDNSMGNQPFLVHMIYAVCLMAKSDIAAKVFSLFLAVSTSIAVYAFCNRFLTRRIGVIAMFVFFAAGMVVEVAVTTRIDVSLAGMLFLTTYSMLNCLATEKQGWLWISGAFAGFSLGIKHSAGLWLLFVGVMYLIERLIRKREHFATVLKQGIAYTMIAAAIASPWYIKNYVWFRNPVYPFLTGEVVEFGPQGVRYFNVDDERKLDTHFDLVRKEAPEIVKGEEEVLTHAVESRVERHPMRPWEFFTRPNAYLMAEVGHYPNYLFLIIPLLVFVRRPKWIMWLLVLSIGFFLTVTWTSWIGRYLLPLYPPLSIVTAYTLAALCDRLEPRVSFARRLPIYVVAAALSMVLATSALLMRQVSTLGFITGTVSRHDFMYAFPYYRPIDFINRELPADARIMTLGAQMNYDIHRDYLSDETWFATKWRRLLVRNDSLEEVNQDLKRQGVTYILFSPGHFTYVALMGLEGGGMALMSGKSIPLSEEARRLGPEYPLLRTWATFSLYQMKYLEVVYTDENGYQVFKIK
jgi:4-amino-4-deoxy-L-arabinose transferase-like glycosyltransferase